MRARTQAVLSVVLMPVGVVLAYAVVIGVCVFFRWGAAGDFLQHMLSGDNRAVSDAARLVTVNRFIIFPLLLAVAALATARSIGAHIGFITAAVAAALIAGYPSALAIAVSAVAYFVWMHVVRVARNRSTVRAAS